MHFFRYSSAAKDRGYPLPLHLYVGFSALASTVERKIELENGLHAASRVPKNMCFTNLIFRVKSVFSRRMCKAN